MKKSLISVGYAISLFVSASGHAAETGPLQALAEEQARQSLAVARQVIRSELAQAMRAVPQVYVERVSLQTALSGAVELGEMSCQSTAPAK